MVFYYSKAGWAANVALFVNVFFIMGVLASLGAVLTLPGIAGIVLTLGMAVDANVLINERIREELHAGKGMKQAIKDGYRNAYSAIIDSNVTTLLTALILGYFGKGPIHGFAVTLGIGIISSLFSAIFITRLIYERQLSKNKIISFSTKFSDNAFKNINWNWLGNRKYFYIFSTLMIVISLGSIVTRGFNQSVDFTGGRTYVIRFDKPVNTVEVQRTLGDAFKENPEVKTFGADNQIKITTQYLIAAEKASEADISATKSLMNNQEPTIDDVVEAKLYTALKDKYLPAGLSFENFIDNYRMSSEKVGPTIASDIKMSAVLSVLFALLVIFLYIVLRFRNWQFGLGAIASLAHDVIFILGVYSLFKDVMPFSMSIDQAFIASILTVVGYSINDTVVVYDRIREFLGLHPKWSKFDTINAAMNSTLSRTMITAGTTLLTLLVMFLLGGEVIRGFIFAMLIGIFVGTYSSVAVASTVMFDTLKKDQKKR
jgi:SecD/SecF fusion protein